eukprot:5468450-Amphidinium_carterae.1
MCEASVCLAAPCSKTHTSQRPQEPCLLQLAHTHHMMSQSCDSRSGWRCTHWSEARDNMKGKWLQPTESGV